MERALKRRVEGDVARAVDEHVNVCGERLRFFLREAQIIFADVAAHDANLVAYEILEGRAVALAHGVEGRRGDDVVPEPRLRLFLRARANGDVDAPDAGAAIDQNRERDLADEPG